MGAARSASIRARLKQLQRAQISNLNHDIIFTRGSVPCQPTVREDEAGATQSYDDMYFRLQSTPVMLDSPAVLRSQSVVLTVLDLNFAGMIS